jgi:hypothetical protein
VHFHARGNDQYGAISLLYHSLRRLHEITPLCHRRERRVQASLVFLRHAELYAPAEQQRRRPLSPAACTLALSPICDPLIEGFNHFVTSMTAPIVSGWGACRMGFAPTGKAPPLHGAHPERTLGHRRFDRGARQTIRSHRPCTVKSALRDAAGSPDQSSATDYTAPARWARYCVTKPLAHTWCLLP